MKKIYELDLEKYPDGIYKKLPNIEGHLLWDDGNYQETDEGVWYEIYANETMKLEYPTIEEDFDNVDSISHNLKGFKGLWLGDYEEYSQITFFVPNEEKIYTFDEMTDIFA